MEFVTLLVTLLAVTVGVVLGYFARQTIAKRQVGTAEAKASQVVSEAKEEEKKLLLEAKEQVLRTLEEAKKEEADKRTRVLGMEERLAKREEALGQKSDNLEKSREELRQKAERVKDIQNEIEALKEEEKKKLEEVAGLPKEKAKSILVEKVEKGMSEELAKNIRVLRKKNREEIEKEAREILATAVQRYAAPHVSETTTTTVDIPNDDMKGRIIGKEGRNIKVIERLTGVEIIVDDTPGAVVISGFDPVRRQVARIALEKLTQDGRIHPARIEEVAEEAKREIAQTIIKAGEQAVYEMGIPDLDPKLVQLIGRLKFRTSYGQNTLVHSLEVAHIASALAAEVGADVQMVRKAGLMHDIGKAIDHEVQGQHHHLSRKILEKFHLPEEVIHAAEAHHDDIPATTPEAFVVKAADAVSAARPGARKDTFENYVKRLEELEEIANNFPGVEKSYAIQAGREVRVLVKPEDVDDYGIEKMAKEIAKKIEGDLTYPGEIKVNVIREKRALGVAR